MKEIGLVKLSDDGVVYITMDVRKLAPLFMVLDASGDLQSAEVKEEPDRSREVSRETLKSVLLKLPKRECKRIMTEFGDGAGRLSAVPEDRWYDVYEAACEHLNLGDGVLTDAE